jgi:hypothetical protein
VFVEASTVASATDCAFIGNRAQQSGAGWFTVGDGAKLLLSRTTFQNSYASCCYPAGYGSKLLSTAALTCADVDSDAVADGRNCCDSNQYSDGAACRPCLDGADCSIGGTSLAQLPLLPGYWRASPDSTDIRACLLPASCAGNGRSSGSSANNTSSTGNILTDSVYCAPGYRGPCK